MSCHLSTKRVNDVKYGFSKYIIAKSLLDGLYFVLIQYNSVNLCGDTER